MSVPEGKRGISKMEFFHTAKRIRNDMTRLLLRDFGVKNVTKNLRTFCYSARMNEADRESFINICNRYHIDAEANYPLWILEHYRNVMLAYLTDMMTYIVKANSIYPCEPGYEYQFNARRQYQQDAIASCYNLLETVQAAGEILPVDYNKIMPYVELIRKEITLLKAWRKSDKKRLDSHLANHASKAD